MEAGSTGFRAKGQVAIQKAISAILGPAESLLVHPCVCVVPFLTGSLPVAQLPVIFHFQGLCPRLRLESQAGFA